MEFYEAISKHYDAIFPLAEPQLKLLQEEFAGRDNILDLACGTGNYALALEALGFNVKGLDLDASMVAEAKRKAKSQGQVGFLVADMRSSTKLFAPGSFGGVFCIGNSLVHLPSKDSISDLIKSVYDLLTEGGIFISQVVNYDRVLHYNVTELPEINNSQEGVKFIRKYNYDPEKKSIIFTGTLEMAGYVPVSNSVELLPLLKEELVEYHREAGFKTADVFGDFKRSPFSLESQGLVVVAGK